MLARISSGAKGIADYLETGRKKGREFDRDLIDARFVLSGDIDTLDAVIDSIQTTQPGAARYLHITLGFSERFTAAQVAGPGEVNLASMAEVTEAYRELLMAAYAREEYAWYAEAHIPRVSHDIHATTGEALERLPYVHIVLPMRNLVDGRYLNPTGYGQLHIPYAQAIQESINARFRLRSPLAVQRGQAAPALAKHKALPEITSAKQLKEALQNSIAEGGIASFEAMVDAARAYGTVRIRKGKDGDYLNVKPDWAAKGINLKGFTRESFQVDRAQEIARGAASSKAPDLDALLLEWTGRVAMEARFLTSSNRKHYQSLDAQGRQAWLQQRAQHAQDRLRVEIGESPDHLIDFTERPGHGPTHSQQLVAVAAHQSDLAKDRRQGPAESFAGLRHVSQLDMAQHADPAAVLLRADAFADLAPQGGSHHAVRRAGGGDSGNTSVNGQRAKLDVAAGLSQSVVIEPPTPDQLKRETSPTLVLEAAAKRCGIDKSHYDITSGRDGAPRIRHQDKHYNLGDFFTKHLEVSWEDARTILEQCYRDTLADSLPPPDRHLWRSFTAWRSMVHDLAKRDKAQSRESLSQTLLEARTKFKAVKLGAQQLPATRRRALLAQARAEKLLVIEEAKAKAKRRQAEHAAPSRNAQYRVFLTELANRGQLNALAELRRLSQPEPDVAHTITGRTSKPVLPEPHYYVDHRGKVTYFQADKAVVTDSVKGVSVIAPGVSSYALALKVAVARYGQSLTLQGDAAFMRGMLDAAHASGLQLQIRDAAKPNSPPLHIERGRSR